MNSFVSLVCGHDYLGLDQILIFKLSDYISLSFCGLELGLRVVNVGHSVALMKVLIPFLSGKNINIVCCLPFEMLHNVVSYPSI